MKEAPRDSSAAAPAESARKQKELRAHKDGHLDVPKTYELEHANLEPKWQRAKARRTTS